MIEPANHDESDRRIGLFCVGFAVAIFLASATVLAFAVATIKMPPDLRGQAYWAEVGERLWLYPSLTAGMILAGIMTVLGLGMMFRAIFRSQCQR
jgi:hypothetical protein